MSNPATERLLEAQIAPEAVMKPAPRRLLLPDGQTIDPEKLDTAFITKGKGGEWQVEWFEANTEGLHEVPSREEADRMLIWLLNQCGITVVAYPAGEAV